MPAVSQSVCHAEPACIMVADDLSGACDAGIWFARNGLFTRVSLGSPTAELSDVIVLSTDSRRLSPQEAAERVRTVAGSLPLTSAGLVFKKIDSTMRGHIAAECDALMDLARAPFGVIVPAVPSQGRFVQDGMLTVRNLASSCRLDIRAVLSEQGIVAPTVSPARAGTVQDLAESMLQAAGTSKYVLCDTTNEEDLTMAAEGLIAVNCRPLWIGAAGLASQAASLLGVEAEHAMSDRISAAVGPVVLCVGSNHEVTTAQLQRVQQAYGGTTVKADRSAAGQIRRAAEGASHLVLVVDTCSTDLLELRTLLDEIRSCSPAAILLTGGDTAGMICKAAEAKGIVLEEEVVGGVPAGHVEGGVLDGIRVATKSGGFGDVNCLVECVRLLHSKSMTEAR